MTKIDQRYISKELSHFVGHKSKDSKKNYSKLKNILKTGVLAYRYDRHAPHYAGVSISHELYVNGSVDFSTNEMYCPSMVCFCDIPTNDLSIHIKKYGYFGLSFSKDFIVRKGGIPVSYIPRNATANYIYEDISYAQYLNSIVKDYEKLVVELKHTKPEKLPLELQLFFKGKPNMIDKLESFFNYSVFSYIKSFDHTLSDEDSENYYFEREWRVIGNVNFMMEDVKRIFIPESYSKRFKEDFPHYYGQVTFTKEKRNNTSTNHD